MTNPNTLHSLWFDKLLIETSPKEVATLRKLWTLFMHNHPERFSDKFWEGADVIKIMADSIKTLKEYKA